MTNLFNSSTLQLFNLSTLQLFNSCAILGLALFIFSNCTREEQQANILFLFSDDHTTQAISAYGDGRIETPHLDQLAAEGILFENCFCTNAICAPSRAVVLTGLHSHLNGIIDNVQKFDGSQQTFPKLLQGAGYRTAIVGKWHLKSEPTGFDYWDVLPGQGEYFDPEFIEMGEKKVKPGYVTDIITDDALNWLSSYNYDQPFCLMVQHKAPHANWEWPESLKDEFKDVFRIPDTFDDDYAGKAEAIKFSSLKVGDYQWKLHYQYRFGEYPYDNDEEMYQRYMHDYMRCIRAVDDNVGRLLEGLKELGLEENTVVIYSADQGFFLGEHGLYDKRFMYEESLRMPLIIKDPRLTSEEGGTRVSEMVLNLDFGPTILDICGVEIPENMQGKSFLPIVNGNRPNGWRTSMYYRFYENFFEVGPQEGVRTERYKLIHFEYPEEGWELYDLQEDPKEMKNLYEEFSFQSTVDSLKVEMQKLQKKIGM